MKAHDMADEDDRLAVAVSRVLAILRTAVDGDGSTTLALVELGAALEASRRGGLRRVRPPGHGVAARM